MRSLFIWLIAAGMLLVAPVAATAQYDTGQGGKPSIGQVLVREGDYAIKLAQALNVVTTDNEVVAEDSLASLGIAPDSGWISDFPVTPDIIGELEPTIAAAAEAGRLLPSGKEAALREFVTLNTELGLTITPAASGGYAEESAPVYGDETVLNDYYDEGPPVITYYAPPPDYAYLYYWDPYPFYWGGIFFPGFYILSDFNCGFGFGFSRGIFFRDEFAFYRHHHFGHHDRIFISNHVFDRDHRHGFRVDPVTRRPFERTAFRPVGARNFDPVSRSGGWNAGRTSFNRQSANRLLDSRIEHNSGFGRVREGAAISGVGQVRQPWSGSSMPSRTVRTPGASTGFDRGFGGSRGFQRPSGSAGIRSGGSFGSAPQARSFSRPMTRERSFGTTGSYGRSYSAPSFGGGRSFGSTGSYGRSYSSPSFGGGRSFGSTRSYSAPSFGGGRSSGSARSYSAPSFGGGRSSGRSFSAPSAGGGHSFGGRSLGSTGGGFGGSMGHGFGGSRGR